MNKMKHVIMCGGSGSRFWPLSTSKMPKQFLKLLGNKSLLRLTVDRLLNISSVENIFLVTSKKYEDFSIWLDNVSESSLIDLMDLTQSKHQRIKIYSLPKMHPKKMLELGVRGEEGYVKDALNFIKDNLDKMKISWRNL